jgi:hypothetical protein
MGMGMGMGIGMARLTHLMVGPLDVEDLVQASKAKQSKAGR